MMPKFILGEMTVSEFRYAQLDLAGYLTNEGVRLGGDSPCLNVEPIAKFGKRPCAV
jgi:hypothetical protein